ncbi:hypothetical protein [Streptomyces viridochromogenes]|jgi:hypothetical protein|uniref:hypothetical protein n=1 Tax=Streptomyces viridochromogenes TaxID=1938 RepID=UPI000B158E82|nr:hypothetical protein [Streptomyces viridochromogenes]
MTNRIRPVLHRAATLLFPATGVHRLPAARPVWPAAPDTVVAQAFRTCGPCGMELPVTLHGDAYLCPFGHLNGGDLS